MHRHTFETLNAMRGVAALAVVLFHADDVLGVQLAGGGYLAVDLFFVLSGFVISYAFDDALSSSRITAGKFALMRLVRFWPLLIAAVAIGMARAGLGIVTSSPTALSAGDILVAGLTSLVLIPAPLDQDGNLFILNVPLWTLCFELVVNLAYGIGSGGRLPRRTLMVIAAISAATMAAFAFQHGSNDIGATMSSAIGGMARASFGFCTGVLLSRHFPFREPKFPPAGLLALLLIFLVVPIPPFLRPTYDILFAVVAAPALIMAGASIEPKGFTLRIARHLGLASFPIYAIHQPVLQGLPALSERLNVPSVWMGSAFIVCLLAFAPAIERYYDLPFRQLLKRLLKL